MLGRRLTPKQVGEYEARDFLGEEYWIKCKQDLDNLLSYRKSIKGKPTDEQRFFLEINKVWIDHYNHMLYSGRNK